MPYTPAQIRKFFAMKARGEKVPDDFEKYARGKKMGAPAKSKRRKK